MADRIGIAITLIALGLLGAILGWPHMAVPIGAGTGMLTYVALHWRRRG